MTSIIEKLNGWTDEDLSNICTLLELECDASPAEIEASIKWLYYSRARQGLKDSIGTAVQLVKLGRLSPIFEEDEAPSWEFLVREFSRMLKVFNEDADLAQLEEYASHAVIAQALVAMTPEKRADFFTKSIDLAEIVENANIRNPGIRGPQTALSLMSAVNLSGFSVYLASTTALGFATGATGVTLPFAAYTGLTTTLSIFTGPIGFSAAILWGAWRFTGPEWKKLAPVVLYIISRDARIRISDSWPDEPSDIETP